MQQSQAEVPLLKGFYLANTPTKQVYLQPIIKENKIDFEIKQGKCEAQGWISRGNLICPCCHNSTDVSTLKQQFIENKTKERLLLVIWNSQKGKEYRLPRESELAIENYDNYIIYTPNEPLPVTYTKAMAFCLWNFNTWGDIFSKRELATLNVLMEQLDMLEINTIQSEYKIILKTYLSIFFNRVLSRETTFGLWNTIGEKIEHPFGKSAIQMVFDYPESNPFALTGGGALNQLEWILRYIESESAPFNYTTCVNSTSGDKNQFEKEYIDSVITDPPYYDAVAYADLSDFFYVWLKKNLHKEYPLTFSTPQTPKSDECTALKHHHKEDSIKAKLHFERKLLEIFDSIRNQTKDTVSIMYAHQSTEAWTTLCNSILGANMNITGSWAIDTERSSAGLKKHQAFLSSSVTVSCRPSQRKGYGAYKDVKRNIERTVEREVDILYRLGFRGADLLTACFGQAVSEFGKYETVEKADGSEIKVAELLEMAREAAFNALLKGFEGDDFTKFYIGWLQLYGFTESEFDDAAKFSRVGLTINVNELFTEHLLIKKGNKQTLGNYQERIAINKRLGEHKTDTLIDQVHRAMHLYAGANRSPLLAHISAVADSPESAFWRVVTSLLELLPAGCNDHKQATGLLSNRDSLIRESKQAELSKVIQGTLSFE